MTVTIVKNEWGSNQSNLFKSLLAAVVIIQCIARIIRIDPLCQDLLMFVSPDIVSSVEIWLYIWEGLCAMNDKGSSLFTCRSNYHRNPRHTHMQLHQLRSLKRRSTKHKTGSSSLWGRYDYRPWCMIKHLMVQIGQIFMRNRICCLQVTFKQQQ